MIYCFGPNRFISDFFSQTKENFHNDFVGDRCAEASATKLFTDVIHFLP